MSQWWSKDGACAWRKAVSSLVSSCVYVGGLTIVCVCAEYSKVAGQTGQQWQMRHVYKGFGLQVPHLTQCSNIDSPRLAVPGILVPQGLRRLHKPCPLLA